MSSTQSPKVPRVRQARKSIAHTPSADITGNKENATVDAGAVASFSAQGKQAAKKSRSKSIGPGGLDALKEGSGNKQEVGYPDSALGNQKLIYHSLLYHLMSSQS